MDVSEFPNVIHDGEVLDSDEDFREDVLIGLISADSDFVSYFIEFWQDQLRFKTDPIGDDWQGVF